MGNFPKYIIFKIEVTKFCNFFLDNCEEEPTYQYFTIKGDDENFVGISDILNLPSLPEENTNNKQIFYLTLDNNEEIPLQENLLQEETLQDNVNDGSVSFNNDTDVKIITLEDGRMFMTTGCKRK